MFQELFRIAIHRLLLLLCVLFGTQCFGWRCGLDFLLKLLFGVLFFAPANVAISGSLVEFSLAVLAFNIVLHRCLLDYANVAIIMWWWIFLFDLKRLLVWENLLLISILTCFYCCFICSSCLITVSCLKFKSFHCKLRFILHQLQSFHAFMSLLYFKRRSYRLFIPFWIIIILTWFASDISWPVRSITGKSKCLVMHSITFDALRLQFVEIVPLCSVSWPVWSITTAHWLFSIIGSPTEAFLLILSINRLLIFLSTLIYFLHVDGRDLGCYLLFDWC